MRPDGRQSGACAPLYSTWCSTSVSHTARIVYHARPGSVKGYTICIFPLARDSSPAGQCLNCKGFQRVRAEQTGFHNAGYKFRYRKLSTTSTKFSTGADVEIPTVSPGNGKKRKTGNRSSFLCESANLLDIIPVREAGGCGFRCGQSAVFGAKMRKNIRLPLAVPDGNTV